jgi:NADPH-dependent glutamate synthase beta subunit-like oxidoreductase|tara:strand:+ start:441 stop:704 length:264 start_codon:yes stop_codon:yes gene_type:complete
MAKYRGRTVKLNKPFRTPNQSKKFAVYVRNRRTGNVVKVRYGDPNMKIKKNIPARRRSFLARHGAILRKVRGQKTLAPVYWAIKSWR